MGVKCLHCPHVGTTYARGLCIICWNNKWVRESYVDRSGQNNPNTTAYGGIPDVNRRTDPLPEKCTDAQPGTAEKIKVMIERAEAGTSLFHPDDPTQLIINIFAVLRL